MQKGKTIRNERTIDLKTFADLFDEDIILFNQKMKVVYMNDSAKQNLKITSYSPEETDCKEVFNSICIDCDPCKMRSAHNIDINNFRIKLTDQNEYLVNTSKIQPELLGKEFILCKGKKIANPHNDRRFKTDNTWDIKINSDYEIIETDDNIFSLINENREELLKKESRVTDFLHSKYTTSFVRLHKKVIETGEPAELLSVLSVEKQEKKVLIKLEPINSGSFKDCSLQLIPFLKDTEDEKTQFEKLRIQNYLYTITNEFARSDNIAKGYKTIVSLVNEVLGTNLCGILHFKGKNRLWIESALINNEYIYNNEPEINDPEIIPYFTRQLIINDEIDIPDVNVSKVIYKQTLIGFNLKSFFALPLKHNLRIVGAIVLGFEDKKSWQRHHIDFVKTIGSLLLHTILQEETSEKLRRVNENFLNIFESSSDAVFIAKLDGKIIEVNRAAEMLSGYSKKELLRKNVSEISKSEQLNLSQMPYEMLQSHQMIFGTELINSKGELIPVETREKMIRYHEQLSVLIIARDVRHRRELNKMMVQTISDTEEKERRRIAEGLHDDVGPLLSTLRIYIDLLKNVELSKEEIDDYAVKMNEIIQQSIETVREVSRNLMPGVLNDFGLIEALDDFCSKINKTGVLRINFDYDAKHYNLGNSIRNIIYSVVKELINNSIKHANASEIILSLNQKENELIIKLHDNGIGFEMKKTIEQNNNGLGIKNLLSKINSISGKLELLNEQGFGVIITVPLQ